MTQLAAIRIVAMPKDANPDGDVFGGWILSMMDIAGAVPARRVAGTRIVTVAMENVQFLLPVFIGDCLECYSHVEKSAIQASPSGLKLMSSAVKRVRSSR